ncbi:MAG: hypothetical protein AAGA48_09860 [Myxococcota bacterium]
MRLFLLGSIGLMACDDLPLSAEWEEIELIDEGTLCLERSGTLLTVTVVGAECLSGSCTRNRSGTCSVSADGANLVLFSDIAWERRREPATCTDDCVAVVATCTTEVDAKPTSFMVTHGIATRAVDVGGSGACGGYYTTY